MITITPTAAQQTKLDAALVFINQQRAAKVPPLPPLTENQWAGLTLLDTVNDILAKASSTNMGTLAVAYNNATPAQQTAARNALGLP